MAQAHSEEETRGDSPSEDDQGVEDALDLFFAGRVEEVLPPADLGEFHDFIREEALRRRRFAVSFRVECGCLAWIGYALSKVVTHEEGIEFKATPMKTYVPDHEPGVEHPEGPTEDPPEDLANWPIWPYEIYQDEMEAAEAPKDFAGEVEEALDDLGVDADGEMARIRERAAHEDPLIDREER